MARLLDVKRLEAQYPNPRKKSRRKCLFDIYICRNIQLKTSDRRVDRPIAWKDLSAIRDASMVLESRFPLGFPISPTIGHVYK
jgi:hypothetical protein